MASGESRKNDGLCSLHSGVKVTLEAHDRRLCMVEKKLDRILYGTVANLLLILTGLIVMGVGRLIK